MNNDKIGVSKIRMSSLLKFVVFSLIGIFLFLIPIPQDGDVVMPIDLITGGLADLLTIGYVNLAEILAILFIGLSLLGTILAYTVKPKFITENERLRELFKTHPVYVISKILGFALILIVYFDGFGLSLFEPIIHPDTGGLMFFLVTLLTTNFLVLAFVITLMTDFGLMEFIGVLIRRFVKVLFRLPGRSSIDLMASWFGSSAVGIIITRGQLEKGFYTLREAATIAINFAVVSLPFSIIVANTAGIGGQFAIWYLIVAITCFILGIILHRIWPLANIKDEYLPSAGKQIDETIPKGSSRVRHALFTASKRAETSGIGSVVKTGLNTYMDIFMDLLPVIFAWGTIAMMIAEFTPIFDWISIPMGWLLQLMQIEGASYYAATTLVGFIDMFIPALMLANSEFAETRFILSALSIVQVVYMAETGILIVKSKIPLNVGKLFVLFLMRTLIGLPIILLLTRLIVSF